MKHFAYIRYSFKKDLPILLLAFAIAFVGILSSLLGNLSYEADDSFFTAVNTFLGWALFVLAFAFPLWQKGKGFTKRSYDLYGALPLTKKGVFLDDLLLGLTEFILIAFLSWVFLASFAPLTASHTGLRSTYLGYALGYYVLDVVIGFLFGTAIVSRAHSLIDGVLFLALAFLGALCFGEALVGILPTSGINPYAYAAFPGLAYCLTPSGVITLLFQATAGRNVTQDYERVPLYPVMIQLGIALLLVLLCYLFASKEKGEEAQLPNNGPFGYPLFEAFALAGAVGIESQEYFNNLSVYPLIILGVATLFYVIIAFVGQRKIRFTWSIVYAYLIGAGVGYTFAFALYAGTHA
jgi:MFS family permease